MRAPVQRLVTIGAMLLAAGALSGFQAPPAKAAEEKSAPAAPAPSAVFEIPTGVADDDDDDDIDVPEPEAAAAGANLFLASVDEQKYQESWLEASSELQSSVRAGQWEETLKSLRQPLGKLVTRKLRSNEPAPAPSGGKSEKYRILIYDSSFEKKKDGVETVIVGLDRYGLWTMTSYLVK